MKNLACDEVPGKTEALWIPRKLTLTRLKAAILFPCVEEAGAEQTLSQDKLRMQA